MLRLQGCLLVDLTEYGYVNSRRTSIGRSIRGDFARVGNDLRTATRHVQSASQTDLFDEQNEGSRCSKDAYAAQDAC